MDFGLIRIPESESAKVRHREMCLFPHGFPLIPYSRSLARSDLRAYWGAKVYPWPHLIFASRPADRGRLSGARTCLIAQELQ